MFDMGLGFLVGLMVGWNVLPQPKWIKDKYEMGVRALYSMVGK